MQGILVVDKPAGMTSHDVVNRVRRLAKMRRVGHTGTLDPMATGVLVLLLGSATRLSRFILTEDKQYRATLRLGVTTTTYDAEGEVTATAAVDVDRATIESALERFRGDILQVPPMYAAIRHQGKRLYEIAREGKEVAREARPLTIYRLDLLDWNPPDLTLDVTCSSGTYIRSLAHDLGQVVGTGAHLTALRRTTSGPFSLDQSYSLNTLEQLAGQGRFDTALLPSYAALEGMPVLRLTPEQLQAVRHGQTLTPEPPYTAEYLQARDGVDELVAILVRLDDTVYRPTIVLSPEP
jgi:tRNA pseudouridine55 synthase